MTLALPLTQALTCHKPPLPNHDPGPTPDSGSDRHLTQPAAQEDWHHLQGVQPNPNPNPNYKIVLTLTLTLTLTVLTLTVKHEVFF